MSNRTFLDERRKAEHPVFMKVLQALPRDRFDYRPHERSPSAADIVWTLALETSACSELIERREMNWKPSPAPSDVEEILSAFEQNYRALSEQMARLDDESWRRKARFLVEGKLVREATVGDFLWFMFFDALHHRGQLSTYIRPMGGKVPSIYGPSGDDPGE